MKTSSKDHFELKLCIGGLAMALIQMNSRLYEYAYYLTFKRTFKNYTKEFNDPWEMPIDDHEFFWDIADPYVQQCIKSMGLLSDAIEALLLRNGLYAQDVLNNFGFGRESERYIPNQWIPLHKKSYKSVTFYCEYYLEEIINTLYYYACALTLRSYTIPVVMRTKLDYSPTGSFRFLNLDDNEVASMVDLLSELNYHHLVFSKKM